MKNDQKNALLETSLQRAADELGDITPHVLARYYARCPEARERFAELQPGGKLEQEMVEQALYCLMEWYNSPAEIRIILTNTIPHHADTLHVRPHLFYELINAVCETISSTIPPHAAGEISVWRDLQGAMRAIVDEGARYARERLPAV